MKAWRVATLVSGFVGAVIVSRLAAGAIVAEPLSSLVAGALGIVSGAAIGFTWSRWSRKP